MYIDQFLARLILKVGSNYRFHSNEEKESLKINPISGIAATLLNNGRTLHSRCKIPLKLTDESMANFSKRDATGKLLQEAAVLIIDEVSMGNKLIFETLDRSLQFVRGNKAPFGGMTMVWATDWRQSLPVVVKGSRGQIVNSCLKSSYLWKFAVIYKLEVNMRVFQNSEDREFSDYLLQCGDGLLDIQARDGPFKVIVPSDLAFHGELDDMINWVFEGLEVNCNDHEWTASRSLICPTNKTVDLINNKVMARFPGAERVYRSHDKVASEDSFNYPQEYLNTLSPSGMPPHQLKVKVGCPIMLMRNMQPQQGHCNGTKYIVVSLHDNIIEAVVASGAYKGNKLFIPRIPIKPTDGTFPFDLTRRQFPVRPCFGITSNKAQGQTLKRVGVYLDRPFFSHGQYYVAKSRVGEKAALKILVVGERRSDGAVITDNVVYPEVL